MQKLSKDVYCFITTKKRMLLNWEITSWNRPLQIWIPI